MVIYDSAQIYIDSATSLAGKITKIDAIINALYATALTSAANDNITEYTLDDGQTKINTIYKGTDSVLKSIKAFESIRELYLNKLNGRVIRLVDSKNLRGGNNGR